MGWNEDSMFLLNRNNSRNRDALQMIDMIRVEEARVDRQNS
jgi:hypothetical protein